MSTVPKILLANASQFGDNGVAMREKALGIWKDITWARQAEEVRSFAVGLASIGFHRGDRLGIIGDNRPRLYQGFMAAQCLGAIPVALYQDSTAAEIRDVITHSGAKVVLVEDQEQVDKLLALTGEMPGVEHIVYCDSKGMRGYDTPMLISFDAVQERSRRFADEHPGFFEEQVEAGNPDDVSVICYTAGTTGAPKGVLLTHRNLFETGDSILAQERWREGDESVLTSVPLAWVGESFVSVFMAVRHRITVNIPESTETVQRDLRELGPTVFVAPPRVWENMLRDVRLRIEGSTRVKRWLYRTMMRLAVDAETLRMERRAVPFKLRVQRRLGELVIFNPLRDQLGLRRVRHAYGGGAPMGPDTLRAFRAIGVNMKQFYGLTECSAFAAVQPDGDVRELSVGPPLPNVEVRIAQDGEVLVHSGGVFKGYHDDAAATAGALVDGGWLRTGDKGYLDDDGHLVILGRAEDVAHLADGTAFAPAWIENKLKFSPYIRDAVALGAGRAHVAAMITFDLRSVGQWAAQRELTYSTYRDLTQRGPVYELLEEEVRRVNEGLPDELAIRRFLVLHKELDPDDGEVTRTRSLRRRVINERYAALIDALYEDVTSARVATGIASGDAEREQVEVEVLICQVGQIPTAEVVVAGGAGR